MERGGKVVGWKVVREGMERLEVGSDLLFGSMWMFDGCLVGYCPMISSTSRFALI